VPVGREADQSDAAPTVADGAATTGFPLTAGQAVRLLIGAVWLYWAQTWIGVTGLVPLGAALAVLTAAGSLWIMGAALTVRGRSFEAHMDRLILVACLAQGALQIVVASSWHGYVSDELAFNQAAASALIHGLNPYGADLASALRQYGVGWGTLTLAGQEVHTMSYPSLSVLLYVPATLLFGTGSGAGLGTDALAWVVGGALLWRMVDASLRPCVALFLVLPIPLLLVGDGATDALYLPFLLVAVWRWDRFEDPAERSPARWVGPIALGLACCVKQSPWLLAPFLVAGVGIEARLRGRGWFGAGARYTLIAGAAFLVPNLAFVVWNPGAWLTEILLPLRTALVPLGIGPAQLVGAYGLGGGDMGLFGWAGAALVLAALLIFVRCYGRLKPVFILLPLLGMLLETRSLMSYFVFAVPVLVVAATTVRAVRWELPGRRLASGLAWGGGLLAAVSAGLLIAALADPPPLAITVQSAHVGAAQLVADVSVANRGTQPVRVHFILAVTGTAEQVMGVTSGPAVLDAGQRASYSLVATDQTPLPAAGYPFQFQLTSNDPAMLAVTPQLTSDAAGNVSP